MRISKLNKTIQMEYGSSTFTLTENVEYVLPDIIIIGIINNNMKDIIVSDVDFYKDKRTIERVYKGESLFGKSLITFRNGGIGDLLFQLPALEKIKSLYKDNVKLTMCCNTQYFDLFKDLDYLDKCNTLPLTMEQLEENDYYVNFEGLIENDKRAESVNSYVLHNEKFFIKPDVNIPTLNTSKATDDIIFKYLIHATNIVIGFKASANIRSVNPEIYANVIAYVGKNYPEIQFHIVGTKSQSNEIDFFIKEIHKQAKVSNFSKKFSDLSSVMSLIKFSDCVIGSDSGIVHIAGALKIPVIGLYGAFPSELRISTYENSIGLNTMSNCFYGKNNKYKSCFQHGGTSCKSAIKNNVIFSPCMDIIKPKDIIDSLKQLKIIE